MTKGESGFMWKLKRDSVVSYAPGTRVADVTGVLISKRGNHSE